MKIFFKFFVIFLFSILFSERFSYRISKNNKEIGISTLFIDKKVIIEKNIFFDGFSREYNYIKTDLNNGNFKLFKYYADQIEPDFVFFENGLLTKKIFSLKKRYNLKKIQSFGLENILSSSYFLDFKGRYFDFNKNIYLDLNGFENKNLKIYKSDKMIPDSIKYYDITFNRSEKVIKVENPYLIKFDKIFIKEDFLKKSKKEKFDLKNSYLEISYSENCDTIVLITPFSFLSDIYGNISFSMMWFTTLQFSENIHYPTAIFKIKHKKLNESIINEAIKEVVEFLKTRYNTIYLLSFNSQFLFYNSNFFKKIILINPPLEDLSKWSEKVFKEFSKRGDFLFKNYEKYIEMENIDKSLSYSKIKTYYDKMDNPIFIFSKDILSNEEKGRIESLKGKIFIIKNVDRTLKSYNNVIENEVYIHSKIFDLLNQIIKKEKI